MERARGRRKMYVQLNNKITIYLFHEFHSHADSQCVRETTIELDGIMYSTYTQMKVI